MRILLCFFLCSAFCGFAQKTTVGSVEIVGNKRTNVSFLLSLAELKSGAVLDSLVLDKDINRFKRLPSIAHANYKVVPTITNEVRVIYAIEENHTLIPSANVYTSTNKEFAYRIGLQEFNFLGRNITLGAFYQKDVYSSYGLGFRAPYLFGPKWGLEVNYQDLTTQEPLFFNGSKAYYRYNNKSIEALGLYQINYKNRVALGLNVFTEDYNYVFGATDDAIPRSLKIDKYLIKLLYTYDNIKYHYQYLSGFKSALNFQYVRSTESGQSEFIIGFNDFLFFKRVGKRGNWANRIRMGLATNIDSPFAPFSVDNNINVRGVGNVIDRGTGSLVLNSEYRYSIIDKEWFVLQGNAFVDAGTWRHPGGDFGDFVDSDNIRVYPGIGIRFIHKRIFNAIFRIDYGHGITKDSSRGIVFGIGQYF